MNWPNSKLCAEGIQAASCRDNLIHREENNSLIETSQINQLGGKINRLILASTLTKTINYYSPISLQWTKGKES